MIAAVLGLITSTFITLEIAKPTNANEASENKSTCQYRRQRDPN